VHLIGVALEAEMAIRKRLSRAERERFELAAKSRNWLLRIEEQKKRAAEMIHLVREMCDQAQEMRNSAPKFILP
jgi:cob(I)alamin adenosyltransferase